MNQISITAGLAAIPVLLWLAIELVARRDRRRRRAERRARARRGFVDMSPPPPGPYNHDHDNVTFYAGGQTMTTRVDPDYDGEAA